MIHVLRPVEKIKNSSITRCNWKTTIMIENANKDNVISCNSGQSTNSTHNNLYAVLNILMHDDFHAMAITWDNIS